MSEFNHKSVLLSECIESLCIKKNGIYFDGTLGLGGHSLEIAKRLGNNGKLICVDKDSYAISCSKDRLKEYLNRIIFVHDDFRNCASILNTLNIKKVDGFLFDLGVSSPQLDNTQRGFSYMNDAPLDMRMNNESSIDASKIVNTYSYDELSKIIYEYGEEKFSRKIAQNIINYREKKPIETTLELVEIIKNSMPASALREKQHPAKRTFQAIRIAVNDELGAVEQMMNDAPDCLNEGGRLCVISFHSLEDRIVKNRIKQRESGCTCPKDSPVCICGFRQTLKTVSRKPIIPTDEEISSNPRARSAKLRVAERV